MMSFEKLAKAIYSPNKSFANNFAPYEPEFFPIEFDVQVRDTKDRFSEYECEQLLKIYSWYKKIKKFTIKKSKVDPTQKSGHFINLNGNEVGFIEKLKSGRYRIGFCITDDREESGFRWSWIRVLDSFDEAKEWISNYYPKIQYKLEFYCEPDKSQKEIEDDFK